MKKLEKMVVNTFYFTIIHSDNNLLTTNIFAELKRNLYAICSEFGPILDVICVKTLKMRGQAFVVFKNIKSAIEAINKLDGFLFFDKRMVHYYRILI